MAGIGGIGAQGFTRLDRDFGDAPLGRLGQRTIEVQQAPPSRLDRVADRPATGIKRLFERLIDALTPRGVRAEGKFRRGLEDMSRTTGNLLGALAEGNGAALKKAMGNLRGDAAPVTSRGTSFDDVLTRRLDVHLGKLSTSELVRVAQGSTRGIALPREQAADFTRIANHVQQAARERLMAEAIEGTRTEILERLETDARPPSDPTASTGNLDGAARNHAGLLHGSGLWLGSPVDELGPAIMKGALAELTPDQRDRFLARLSFDELQSLRASSDDFGRQPGIGAVNDAIANRLGEIRELHRESVLIKLDHALSNLSGIGRKPDELLKLLQPLDQSLEELRHVQGDFTEIDGRYGELMGALTDLRLDPGAVRRLPDRDFIALKGLLSAHAPGRSTEEFRSEIETRRAQITNAVAGSMVRAFELLTGGNVTGFVKSFARILETQETGLRTIHAMLGKEIGGDDRQTFRQQVSDAFLGLAAPDPKARQELFARINAPDVAPVFDWLGEVGGSVRLSGTPVGLLGLQMYAMFTDLSMELSRRVATDTDAPAPRFEFDPRAPLDETARLALAMMGVHVENGREHIARFGETLTHDPVEAGLYATDLDTMRKGEATKMQGDLSISEIFAKDIARDGRHPGNYMIDYGDGAVDIVPDAFKPSKDHDDTAVHLKSEERLLALFQGDREMVASVTRIMHQGMLGFMMEGWQRPETNPLRERNGDSVGIAAPDTIRKTYTISKDPDGTARINLVCVVETDKLIVGGEIKMGDRKMSASWDVELTVRTDGTISVERFGRAHHLF